MVRRSMKGALRRARARKKSAGAAMFIVAVTLGLLAAMGVYGLAATASDVRAAGHVREAAQAQHAAELAIVEAAQTIGPGTASTIVRAMQASSTFGGRTTNCKSSKPLTTFASDPVAAATYRVAEACMVLSPTEMKTIAQNQTWNVADSATTTIPFSTTAFGAVNLTPFVRVELTNPIDWDIPAGYQVSSGSGVRPPIFTQIRATVYLEMRANGLTAPADIVATGRGRLLVGPYTP